jgi:hypothetical protein
LTIVDSGRIRLTCRSVALISVFLASALVTGLKFSGRALFGLCLNATRMEALEGAEGKMDGT